MSDRPTPAQRMARNIVASLIGEYMADADAEMPDITNQQSMIRSELLWIKRRLRSDQPL